MNFQDILTQVLNLPADLAVKAQNLVHKQQEKIATMSETVNAGGNMVVMSMDSKYKITNLEFNVDGMNQQQKELLQDLVVMAYDKAVQAVNMRAQQITLEVGKQITDILEEARAKESGIKDLDITKLNLGNPGKTNDKN